MTDPTHAPDPLAELRVTDELLGPAQTRRALQRGIAELLQRGIDLATRTADPSMDCAPVVTVRDLKALRDLIAGAPLPEPEENRAELRTPALLELAVVCPECGLYVFASVTLSAVLTVDDAGGELKAKVKTAAVAHVCGQLPLALEEPPVEWQAELEDEPAQADDE